MKGAGVFAGISSGTNIGAMTKAIKKSNLRGKRIIKIATSFGERYLSTPLKKDAQ